MRKLILILFYVISASLNASTNCDAQRTALKSSLYKKYNIDQLRSTTNQVITALTTAERANLYQLSNIFNSIEHDTPEHQNDRYVLQDKAKKITRTAVRRAGFNIINPETGDPFDAELFEVISDDDFTEYVVEVTELLISKVPLPHVTLWFYRRDPTHNPYKIISLKIKADPADDTVMWWLPDFSDKMRGPVDQFVDFFLPDECK